MTFREEIFRILDDGRSTLVFPTENASRYWLAEYARKKHTSIAAERALAFDEFRMRFSPKRAEKPAGKYHRIVFASDFLDRGDTGMDYLYRDALRPNRTRFVPFIAGILYSLGDVEQAGFPDFRLKKDLLILKSAYSAFLERNGLFEPGWEKCRAPEESSEDYVLAGYDADVQMQMLMKDLGPVPYIRTLELKEPETATYRCFFTEEAEIETLFRELEVLKEKGVPTGDILISTPSPETLRPRLERKAGEFGTPLSFMTGVDIKLTVPGQYLFALRTCLEEGLSFRSLENLFLNGALPFSNPDKGRKIVDCMTESGIRTGNAEYGEDPLLRVLERDADTAEYYRNFKNCLTGLKKARDGQSLLAALHSTASLLFGREEFSASKDPVDRDVYSFIISELLQMEEALDECSMKMPGIFSVFMNNVEKLQYVMQEKRTGIRVYPYGQDLLLDVPYHFVMGLNDSNCRITRSEYEFLEDHEAPHRQSWDVTDRTLMYYGTLSPHVSVSGSDTSFEGPQSIPTFFILNDSSERENPSFPSLSVAADSVSMKRAEVTSLGERGADIARDGGGEPLDPKVCRLSYTSLSDYAKCPYLCYLKKNLIPKVRDDFEPAIQDDAEMGSFLHRVIQSFMQSRRDTLLVPQNLEEYHREIEQILDRELEKAGGFDFYTKLTLRSIYCEPLKAVLTELLTPPDGKPGHVGPFIPRCNELKLDDALFTGRVDTLIEDENGNVCLLDYKKGKADATYQLVLYRRLYENNPENTKKVAGCWFYSMKESVFKGLDDAKEQEMEAQLDEETDLAVKGYGAGEWKATPSEKSCEKCSERVICRRRYNLQ
ncbi:MAG: PD-(D/E)XK nuclease family protein [Spirochaetales bacterium]|nr:PD-(D/E)XK nuclease family protein [Spirochaetales bacterium]